METFLEDYCKYLEGIRTRKSYKNDISYLRTFFGPICPRLKPRNTCNTSKPLRKKRPKVHDTLRGRHVQVPLLEQVSCELVSRFITDRVNKDGISAKTANRLREVLHRMFNYAIKEKAYRGPEGSRTNPVSDIQRRQEPAPTIRFLTIPEMEEQLHILQEQPTLHAMVATLIYAGLRREALLWLTTADVDLGQRLIRVCAKEIADKFWQPKTKRNRVVPISPALYRILSGYCPERTNPWFFPSPRGMRWDPDNFSETLRKVNRQHGLSWSSLDYRHTFGSHLAQKGESLYKIAALMGNSPEICRKHYAALIPHKMHDVVDFDRKQNGQKTEAEDLVRLVLDNLADQIRRGDKPKLRVAK